MREDDPVDLDGDGEFDAIDMMMLEEEGNEGKKNSCGCSIFLLLSIITPTSVCVIKRMMS